MTDRDAIAEIQRKDHIEITIPYEEIPFYDYPDTGTLEGWENGMPTHYSNTATISFPEYTYTTTLDVPTGAVWTTTSTTGTNAADCTGAVSAPYPPQTFHYIDWTPNVTSAARDWMDAVNTWMKNMDLSDDDDDTATDTEQKDFDRIFEANE